ncbi:7467_t:CDS:2, partial [Paraglomus occultum]
NENWLDKVYRNLLDMRHSRIHTKSDSITSQPSESPLSSGSSPTARPSRDLTPEEQKQNFQLLITPIIFVYNILYAITSKIVSIILYCLTPVFFILSVLYHIFLHAPYTVVKRIFTVFYPLYVFCTVAAIIGTFVGGVAGWFSEIIVSVLNAPVGAIISDQESKRAKARRRAAILASLKERHGNRLPDELRDKLINAQQGLRERRGYNGVSEGFSASSYGDRIRYGDRYISNQQPLSGGGVVVGN